MYSIPKEASDADIVRRAIREVYLENVADCKNREEILEEFKAMKAVCDEESMMMQCLSEKEKQSLKNDLGIIARLKNISLRSRI